MKTATKRIKLDSARLVGFKQSKTSSAKIMAGIKAAIGVKGGVPTPPAD